MSAQSTPDASPIQPLHHPDQAAQIQVPQAPLGNATNAPGMGGKALLAKKLASKPAYVSPSDQLMTPCTAKLSQAKKKHFNKGKPIRFAFNAGAAAADDDDDAEKPSAPTNGSPLAQSAQEDDEDSMDVEEAEQAPAPQSRLQPAEF